jgi:hypothetical protein
MPLENVLTTATVTTTFQNQLSTRELCASLFQKGLHGDAISNLCGLDSTDFSLYAAERTSCTSITQIWTKMRPFSFWFARL